MKRSHDFLMFETEEKYENGNHENFRVLQNIFISDINKVLSDGSVFAYDQIFKFKTWSIMYKKDKNTHQEYLTIKQIIKIVENYQDELPITKKDFFELKKEIMELKKLILIGGKNVN